MRLYYTGASPDNLRKAREHAPSHCHGYGWTPQKMTADVDAGLDAAQALDLRLEAVALVHEPVDALLQVRHLFPERRDLLVLLGQLCLEVLGDALPC